MSARRPTAVETWSLSLDALFAVLLLVFFVLVASGQRGGTTFFSNPLLSVTLLLTAGSAIAGGVIATVALFRPGQRSLVLLIPVVVGAFVLYFTLAEVLGHD